VTCTDFLSKLTDYFDGQIGEELMVEVKQHIAECHHCHVVLDTTKQTIEVYRDNEIYEFSTDLQTRMRATIMSRCRALKAR